MKVFLSWSGSTSHQVACVLHDWLPSVIQSIRPYVSSEDIDKGARWSTDIAKELIESSYGIICITSENIDAPWLNFEAGALSRTIDKSNVTPFLYHVKPAEIQGPLVQFQMTLYEKDDILKLIKSINNKADQKEQLSEALLIAAFEKWYPDLVAELEKVRVHVGTVNSSEDKVSSQEVIEEILEIVRQQQRLLVQNY